MQPIRSNNSLTSMSSDKTLCVCPFHSKQKRKKKKKKRSKNINYEDKKDSDFTGKNNKVRNPNKLKESSREKREKTYGRETSIELLLHAIELR